MGLDKMRWDEDLLTDKGTKVRYTDDVVTGH